MTSLPSPTGMSLRTRFVLCTVAMLAWTTAPAQQMDPNMHMTMPMPASRPAEQRMTPHTVRRKPIKRPAVPATIRRPAPAGLVSEDPSGKVSTVSPEGADQMPAMEMPMPVTPPRESLPVPTEADRAAALAPAVRHAMHDNAIQSFVRFDHLETWNADPGVGQQWEARAWVGTDLNRAWLRSEGTRLDNHTVGDLEVLYGHSVATWWDVVVGVQHAVGTGDSRDLAAIGVMGMAPYKYEVEATAYVGTSGRTSARLQAEYDTLLTGRLILQSLVEVNLSGHDDPARGIGAGLSTVQAGGRLRYEFTRRFAPYIGVVQEHAYGKTARLQRATGKDATDTRVVAGIRIWF